MFPSFAISFTFMPFSKILLYSPLLLPSFLHDASLPSNQVGSVKLSTRDLKGAFDSSSAGKKTRKRKVQLFYMHVLQVRTFHFFFFFFFLQLHFLLFFIIFYTAQMLPDANYLYSYRQYCAYILACAYALFICILH